MAHSTDFFNEQILGIEQSGIVIMRDISSFSTRGKDFICPFLVMVLNHKGVARAYYDLREVTQSKNEIACVLPNHVFRLAEYSDDYLATYVIISKKMFQDLRFHTFSHDYEKFNSSPICSLTDQQAEHMMSLVAQLEKIMSYTDKELPHRHNMLMALMAVGYEFLNCYRREQDIQWSNNRNANIFSAFCSAVIEHYRESREVKYYAELLHLTPKYFSKVLRIVTKGLSPSDWIEQYVLAQAKRIIETNPAVTVQEVAYQLGFNEPASFCRFFKRGTGITAKQYRASVRSAAV